jgi:hypothetical protein
MCQVVPVDSWRCSCSPPLIRPTWLRLGVRRRRASPPTCARGSTQTLENIISTIICRNIELKLYRPQPLLRCASAGHRYQWMVPRGRCLHLELRRSKETESQQTGSRVFVCSAPTATITMFPIASKEHWPGLSSEDGVHRNWESCAVRYCRNRYEAGRQSRGDITQLQRELDCLYLLAPLLSCLSCLRCPSC